MGKLTDAGKYKISTQGEGGVGRCEKCHNTNLEQFKRCMVCLKGAQPERTTDNSRTIHVKTINERNPERVKRCQNT